MATAIDINFVVSSHEPVRCIRKGDIITLVSGWLCLLITCSIRRHNLPYTYIGGVRGILDGVRG